MKTNSIYQLSILLILFLALVGCSSDSSEESIIYHLTDKNGKETTVFDYGDEMLIELIITNTTDHTLQFDDESDFIKNAVVVYNSEGHSYNSIVSEEFIYNWKRPITIASGEQYKRSVAWPWNIVPLPADKYYSPCTIDFGELSNRTYTANFEIK